MTPVCRDCKKGIPDGFMYIVGNYELQCPPCHDKAEILLTKPGYHLKKIAKGVLGEPSKIFEEVEEFRDAVEQGVSIMALVELSDLMGAISAYLGKHHPSVTMDDLQMMRSVTERAFQNGRR